MPFVYSAEDEKWPKDAPEDYEPPPPRPEQFVYVPPPDFGGAKGPVRFFDSASRKHASTGPSLSLRGRFLMWMLGKSLPGVGDFLAPQKQRRQDAALHRQAIFSIMVPALREIGGRQVYCVYDGGNDEGFAWFSSLETSEGKLTLDEACRCLAGTGVTDRLRQALRPDVSHDQSQGEASLLRETLEYSLPDEWAALLLGEHFGTGPYSMYGAFTVDLETCTIRDDRGAGVPENGNIFIGGKEE